MKVAHLSERAEDHVVFSDGLGVRVRALSESGEPVQRFTLHTAFTPVQHAVQERVTRLTNLHHVKFGRIRGFEKAPKGGAPVIVTSDVEGRRLSDVLLLAGHGLVTLDAGPALQVTREVLAALTVLHDSRNVTHGSLAPERVVLTPHGRVVVVEHVLSQALDKLKLPRHQLWRDWRIATPPAAGPVRFDPRTDLAQVGLLVLAVVLGRPIEEEEYPHQLRALLPQVQNRLGRSTASGIARDVQSWLERLLPIESRNPFTAVKDAQLAFEALVSSPAASLGMSPAKVKALLTACAALDSIPASPTTAPDAPAESAIADGPTTPLEVVMPPASAAATPAAGDVAPPAEVASTSDAPGAVTSEEVDIEALLRLAAELDAVSESVPLAGPQAPPVSASPLLELVADVEQAEPTADDVRAVEEEIDLAAPLALITHSRPVDAEVWDVRWDSLIELANERVELHQRFADLLAQVAPEPGPTVDVVSPSSLVQDTVRWSFEPETERQREYAPPVSLTAEQTDETPDAIAALSEVVEPAARPARRHRGVQRRRSAGVVPEKAVVGPISDNVVEASAVVDAVEPGFDVALIVADADVAAAVVEAVAEVPVAPAEMPEAVEAVAVVDAALASTGEEVAAHTVVDDLVPVEVIVAPAAVTDAPVEAVDTVEPGFHVALIVADADVAAAVVEAVAEVPVAPAELPEAVEAVAVVDAALASTEEDVAARTIVDDAVPVGVSDAPAEVVQAPADATDAVEPGIDVTPIVAYDVAAAVVEPVAEVPAALAEMPEAVEAAAVVDAVLTTTGEDVAARTVVDDVVPVEIIVAPAAVTDAPVEAVDTEPGVDVAPIAAYDVAAAVVEPVAEVPASLEEMPEAIEADAVVDAVVDAALTSTGEDVTARTVVDDVVPVEIIVAPAAVTDPPVEAVDTELGVDVALIVADADVAAGVVEPVAEAPASLAEMPEAVEAVAVVDAALASTEDDVAARAVVDDAVPVGVSDAPAEVIEAPAHATDVVESGVDVVMMVADAADVAPDVVEPVAEVPAALAEMPEPIEAVAVVDAALASTEDDVAAHAVVDDVVPVEIIVAPAAVTDAPVEAVDTVEPGVDVALIVADADVAAGVVEPVADIERLEEVAEPPAAMAMPVDEVPQSVVELSEEAAEVVAPVATPAPKTSSARRRRSRPRKGTTRTEPIALTLPATAAAVPVAIVPPPPPAAPPPPVALLPVAASSAPGRGPSLMERDVPAWQPPADLGTVLEAAARRAPVTRPAAESSEVASAPAPDLAIAPSPLAEPGIVWPGAAGAESKAADAGTRRLTLVEIAASAGVNTPPAATVVTGVSETVDPAPIVEVAPKPRTIVVFTQGVNWRRTVAAAVLLAVLESAAFAAAWWWVQPGAKGTLVVQTSVPGVEVLVDGKTVGHTPFHDDLRPGRHTLTLRRGGLERNMPVEISLGVVTTQTLSWPDALTGALRVTSAPDGAEVLIAGRVRGRTPLTLDGLSAGRHTLLVRSESGTVSTTASVVAGETVTVDVPIFAGWVQVHAPVDLTVSVNGTRVGSSLDGQMLLAPGTHRIDVSSEALGFSDTLSATVEPGKVRNLTVTLPSVPLAVTGEDGAEVLVDGVSHGTLPDPAITVPLGTHEVVLRRPDGSERRRTLTVRVGTPVSLD